MSGSSVKNGLVGQLKRQYSSEDGFTLIEVVIVIVILGILASVATMKMGETIDTAKFEQTKNELDNLALAIVGNPDVYSGGARSDFGFVGDNGTLPPNLDALVTNPGGWTTWDGPYIGNGPNPGDFKKDAWNVLYAYSDTLIRSTGSGSNIDKVYAGSSAALLTNVVSGWVVDANRQVPPTNYNDSVSVILTYPNGSGGLANAASTLSASGQFSFSNVPIGNHTLRVIYIPDSDTVTHAVAVNPARDVKLDIIFPADLW